MCEFKNDPNKYLARRESSVKDLAACIRFNHAHRAQEMPYFEQELMEQAQEKGPITEKAYKQALSSNLQLTRKDGLDSALKKFKLNALICPTCGPARLTDWANGTTLRVAVPRPRPWLGIHTLQCQQAFTLAFPSDCLFWSGVERT